MTSSYRGRTASCLTAPAQNPGVRFFRTGLFVDTRYRMKASERTRQESGRPTIRGRARAKRRVSAS